MDTVKEMDMNNSSYILTLNYGMLRSLLKTILPDVPTTELRFYTHRKREPLCMGH